jgi:hypothetical protein
MRADSLTNGRSRSLRGSTKPRTLSISEIELRVRWAKTIENILTDFIDNVERQRREAKKANKPPPAMIKSLDDLAKIWELLIFIVNQVQESIPQSTSQPDPIEEKNKEKLLEDEEFRDLVVALHRRKLALQLQWDEEERKT